MTSMHEPTQNSDRINDTLPRTDEPMVLACTFRMDGFCTLHGGVHAELDEPERDDSPDTRLPGAVAELRYAAVTALEAFHPQTREQVEDMLLFWRRRQEMTDADMTAVLDAMFPEPARRDDGGFAERFLERMRQQPVGCPDWCIYDHSTDDERDDLPLHLGDDHIDGTVRKLLDADKLSIRVARVDSLTEGKVGVPNLYVRCEVELTTWEQAAELAREILDGFGYLKGAEKP